MITDITDVDTYGLTTLDLERVDYQLVTNKCGDMCNKRGEALDPLSEQDDELIQRYIQATCTEIRLQGGGGSPNNRMGRPIAATMIGDVHRGVKECSGCGKDFKHTGSTNHYCIPCMRDRPETWGVHVGGGGSRHVIHKEYLD